VPVSPGKDAIVHGLAHQADFLLLWCGKGGDVYNFVMDMEKCEFPEAVKMVAEKCGIAIPRQKQRSPEERKENQQRSVLVEMHREAQTFFVKQLQGTAEESSHERTWRIGAWTRRRSSVSVLVTLRAAAMRCCVI